jgi:uroporphyrin-III C-methyltransferase
MSVYLVGAGPGDPQLITVRGLALLRRCDVLVHDRLVPEELLAEAPSEARRIAREMLSQAEVNRVLVACGRAGLEVVRLKGGDPFVFARGGEEALALAQAGVPFEVVPGVSCLSAVPAAAGIPITHRRVASQVTLLSGHAPEELDFDALAKTRGTLVVFMGLATLPVLVAGLVDAGLDPTTPAAVVARGTRPDQSFVCAPLAELVDAAGSLEPPALVVVGDVVSLGERLRGSREAALPTRS